MTPREDKLLDGNRVLTQRIAHLRESAQRSWESLENYVTTRTEEHPCGFCGSWGEHDNDACDLVAVVTSLEEDFGCGDHWLGETIPEAQKTPFDQLPGATKAEFVAMAGEMERFERDPLSVGVCGCGYPVQPCLRLVLRNGPPWPSRPCEPIPVSEEKP